MQSVKILWLSLLFTKSRMEFIAGRIFLVSRWAPWQWVCCIPLAAAGHGHWPQDGQVLWWVQQEWSLAATGTWRHSHSLAGKTREHYLPLLSCFARSLFLSSSMIQTGVRQTLDWSRKPRLAIGSLMNLCGSISALYAEVWTQLVLTMLLQTRLLSSH